MSQPCRHCTGPIRGRSAPRGLCWRCYRTPGVWEATPRLKPGPKRAGEAAQEVSPTAENDREPTAAELEAMIAEQLAALPEWWFLDCARVRAAEHGVRVYRVARCA
jgi:hypothetical protein